MQNSKKVNYRVLHSNVSFNKTMMNNAQDMVLNLFTWPMRRIVFAASR